MPLQNIIEQDKTRRLIERMVTEERLPHALLFWGPSGVGKSATAIELARWLSCDEFPAGPCGECRSCLQFRTLEHPHFRWIFPLPRSAFRNPESGDLSDKGTEEVAEVMKRKGNDPYVPVDIAGAQFILIGQIRALIQWATIKTFTGKPRLALVEKADKLKEEAGNALLKLLEEPPPDFFLVLTVETPEDILDTLRSRCHSVEFDRLSSSVIAVELQKRGSEDSEQTRHIARFCGGSLGRALEVAGDLKRANQMQDLAIEIVRHSLTKDPTKLDEYLDEWQTYSHRERMLVLDIVAAWLRDAAVIQALGKDGESRVIHSQRLDLLNKFVQNCPQADFIKAVSYVEKARRLLESNMLPALTLVMLARNLYASVYRRRPI
jgi:DNA polymerase-3 subunit delta'